MSFSGRPAQSFFGPLKGKTTTFLLEGRQENIDFARTAASFLGREKEACSILDLDAFYSSNADRIFAIMEGEAAKSTSVLVPSPDSIIEEDVSRLFETGGPVIIIDSLNSLYHLLSKDEGTSRTRKLTFAVASLSFFARTNNTAVLLAMYRREGFGRSGAGRPISSLSDATASVGVSDGEIAMKTERGTAWPGGRFSTRIP